MMGIEHVAEPPLPCGWLNRHAKTLARVLLGRLGEVEAPRRITSTAPGGGQSEP
jgi:hypothetical protein